MAPPKRRDAGVRDVRHNRPERLRALDLLSGGDGGFGRALYAQRQRIESAFGGLATAGLDHLPAWVRRPRRVARWVAGKILLSLCRLNQKQ